VKARSKRGFPFDGSRIVILIGAPFSLDLNLSFFQLGLRIIFSSPGINFEYLNSPHPWPSEPHARVKTTSSVSTSTVVGQRNARMPLRSAWLLLFLQSRILISSNSIAHNRVDDGGKGCAPRLAARRRVITCADVSGLFPDVLKVCTRLSLSRGRLFDSGIEHADGRPRAEEGSLVRANSI
jgi:hypothetical protein